MNRYFCKVEKDEDGNITNVKSAMLVEGPFACHGDNIIILSPFKYKDAKAELLENGSWAIVEDTEAEPLRQAKIDGEQEGREYLRNLNASDLSTVAKCREAIMEIKKILGE